MGTRHIQLLVIGSGGREHALVWKLAQSADVDQIWCALGNAGIGEERCTKTGALVECLAIGAEEGSRLLTFALEKHPALTIVGPDNPLALGIVDRLGAEPKSRPDRVLKSLLAGIHGEVRHSDSRRGSFF